MFIYMYVRDEKGFQIINITVITREIIGNWQHIIRFFTNSS